MEKGDLPLLLGGALLTGAIDGAMEIVWYTNPEKWSGKFPYIETIPQLPPVDDWIVLAIPTVLTIAGHVAKKPEVKTFGIGGLLYALGMFTHHILMRTIYYSGVKFGRQPRRYELPLQARYPPELPLIKEI